MEWISLGAHEKSLYLKTGEEHYVRLDAGCDECLRGLESVLSFRYHAGGGLCERAHMQPFDLARSMGRK